MYILALLAAAAASPVDVPSSGKTLSFAEAGKMIVASERKQAQTRHQIGDWPNERVASELGKSISGKSKLLYQIGHGGYVEYTAADGNLRMWYPKNQNVVKGSWGIREMRGNMRACFHYSNAVNPVTQVFEPTECVPAEQTLSGGDVIQSWDGDVFRLMEDKIPYPKGVMDIPSPQGG